MTNLDAKRRDISPVGMNKAASSKCFIQGFQYKRKMEEKMKIGILGAGRIAVIMAKTIAEMKDAELYAVAARSLDRAEAFAKANGVAKAYGSYEEMLNDPLVELVYIATPHSHHYEHAKLCIEHKKPVLCEKAFTLNADQAKKLIELSRKENVYLAEAIWTRYMPSRKMINDLLASGIIGKVTTVTSNLCYPITEKERIVTPELAGGALLDISVYGLNFSIMHFGKDFERIESSVQMTDKGVDGMETITIFYKDGRMATVTSSIYSRSDRKGIFYGDKGYMIVENINNPNLIQVFDTEDKLIKSVNVPEQITGYEYEVQESMKQIQAGKIESESMPLEETVFVMELMDKIRAQWNLVYPQEK